MEVGTKKRRGVAMCSRSRDSDGIPSITSLLSAIGRQIFHPAWDHWPSEAVDYLWDWLAVSRYRGGHLRSGKGPHWGPPVTWRPAGNNGHISNSDTAF